MIVIITFHFVACFIVHLTLSKKMRSFFEFHLSQSVKYFEEHMKDDHFVNFIMPTPFECQGHLFLDKEYNIYIFTCIDLIRF